MVAENDDIPSDQKRKQISRSGSSDDSEDENMNRLYKRTKIGEESFTTGDDDDDDDDYDDYYNFAGEDVNQKQSSTTTTGAGTSASAETDINARDQDEEASLQSEMLKEMVKFLETNIALKEEELERCVKEENDLLYRCVGEPARIATDGSILETYMDYLTNQFRLCDPKTNERRALEYELKRLKYFLNYHQEMIIAFFFVLVFVSLMR